MNTYRERAEATKARRRAKGHYATPTELAIYRKTLARGNDANLTPEDVVVLAGCKWLPTREQRRYAEMAQAQAA